MTCTTAPAGFLPPSSLAEDWCSGYSSGRGEGARLLLTPLLMLSALFSSSVIFCTSWETSSKVRGKYDLVVKEINTVPEKWTVFLPLPLCPCVTQQIFLVSTAIFYRQSWIVCSYSSSHLAWDLDAKDQNFFSARMLSNYSFNTIKIFCTYHS